MTSDTVFSAEDAEKEPEEMIQMTPFEEKQELNTTLEVKCSAAGFLTSATIQFALEFAGKSELVYLPSN